MSRLQKQAVQLKHLLNPLEDPRIQEVPNINKKKPKKDKNFKVGVLKPQPKPKPVPAKLDDGSRRPRSYPKPTPVPVAIGSDYIRAIKKELANAKAMALLGNASISRDSIQQAAQREVEAQRDLSNATMALLPAALSRQSANVPATAPALPAPAMPALMPPSRPLPALPLPAVPDPSTSTSTSAATPSTSTSTSTSTSAPVITTPDPTTPDPTTKAEDEENYRNTAINYINASMTMDKFRNVKPAEKNTAEALYYRILNQGLANVVAYVSDLEKNYPNYLADINKIPLRELNANQFVDSALYDVVSAFTADNNKRNQPENEYLKVFIENAQSQPPAFSSPMAINETRYRQMPTDFLKDANYSDLQFKELFEYINTSKHSGRMMEVISNNTGLRATTLDVNRKNTIAKKMLSALKDMQAIKRVQKNMLAALDYEAMEKPETFPAKVRDRLYKERTFNNEVYQLYNFSKNLEALFNISYDSGGNDETTEVHNGLVKALGQKYLSPFTVVEESVQEFFTLKPSPVVGRGLPHPLDSAPAAVKDLLQGLMNTLGSLSKSLAAELKPKQAELKPKKKAGAVSLAGTMLTGNFHSAGASRTMRGDFTTAGNSFAMAGCPSTCGGAKAMTFKLPPPDVAPLTNVAVAKPKRKLTTAQLENLALGRAVRAGRLAMKNLSLIHI